MSDESTLVQKDSIINGYQFLEKIGSGGFSEVYKVLNLKFNQIFCAKVTKIKVDNRGDDDASTMEAIENSWASFDNEVNALLKLDHPHIIRLYDHFNVKSTFFLILEYCPNGSLEDEIKRDGYISGNRFLIIAQQLISALSYSHQMGVSHRDIKPQNVLFDEFERVKLADFGISTTEKGKIVNNKCSFAYAPLEVLKGEKCNPMKGDIWSLGITLIYTSTGKFPFPMETVSSLKMSIMNGYFIIDRRMPIELNNFVRKMIAIDPEMRISAEDAFQMINMIMKAGRAKTSSLDHISSFFVAKSKSMNSPEPPARRQQMQHPGVPQGIPLGINHTSGNLFTCAQQQKINRGSLLRINNKNTDNNRDLRRSNTNNCKKNDTPRYIAHSMVMKRAKIVKATFV